MEYDPYDSSGTDDDLPPTHQNRGPRGGHVTGNGRTPAGPFPYLRVHNEMEAVIHRLEQEAYTSVLRAFKAQSDAISWEKESLITELRKELRVSDEEHRELLSKVNADDVICRIRESRQGGGAQSNLHHSSKVVHDPEPSPTLLASSKRQKSSHSIPSLSTGPQSPVMPSHSVATSKQPFSSAAKWGASAGTKGKKAKTHVQTMPIAQPPADPASLIGRKVMTRWPDDNSFYEAVITNYNPVKGEHALVYDMHTHNETWEWVKLGDMAPEDIRWDSEDQGISNQEGWGASGPGLRRLPTNNSAIPGAGRGRGRFRRNELIKDYAPSQNGIGKKDFDHIDIRNTESIAKEVERVLSNPDMYEIEKAKKLLKDQEQSLLDAIARLDEASDGESEDMRAERQEGSGGDHMGGKGITYYR